MINILMSLALSQIEAEVTRLAKLINAPPRFLPAFDEWREADHVTLVFGTLDLVTVERGKEIDRVSALDAGDLLFHIFVRVAAAMAREVDADALDPDARRGSFLAQLDVLGRLDAGWRKRRAAEFNAILQKHPIDRADGHRRDCFARLMGTGLPPGPAWQQACEMHPPQLSNTDDHVD